MYIYIGIYIYREREIAGVESKAKAETPPSGIRLGLRIRFLGFCMHSYAYICVEMHSYASVTHPYAPICNHTHPYASIRLICATRCKYSTTPLAEISKHQQIVRSAKFILRSGATNQL